MNAKKLSAVLTAALLAGALSTTALAADRLPTGDASVTFKKAIDMTDAAGAGGVVSITPLDAAPAPAQASLTIQGSGTAYFTGFAFDTPGDYRYTVTQAGSTAAHTVYDTHSYTVTIRVTGRPDGGLNTELWAVRSGETAKADSVKFTNRYDPPAEEAKTTVVRPAKNTAAPAARTAKGSAAPALPQTGDAFPVEALAAALCAGLVGFATAWSKHR